MVIVNVSPIDYGHVLLVPDPSSCVPQVCYNLHESSKFVFKSKHHTWDDILSLYIRMLKKVESLSHGGGT